jgi:hypothetical protein
MRKEHMGDFPTERQAVEQARATREQVNEKRRSLAEKMNELENLKLPRALAAAQGNTAAKQVMARTNDKLLAMRLQLGDLELACAAAEAEVEAAEAARKAAQDRARGQELARRVEAHERATVAADAALAAAAVALSELQEAARALHAAAPEVQATSSSATTIYIEGPLNRAAWYHGTAGNSRLSVIFVAPHHRQPLAESLKSARGCYVARAAELIGEVEVVVEAAA